ncbi:MAG TPA: 1-acyl-sn-glycerol-3-phosphate acyltransferase [Dehalococcoidia bacterium]|nr:1-acyl-sn-glycerol-3-phosphate acyltransferase [Dehalococcoidia bacterium]
MHWLYYLGRYLTWVLLFLFTRFEVRGKESIPSQGPLLIVVNHLNLADPPIIGVSIRRKAVFLAKEELFRSRVIGYVVRNYGAFPVRRGGMNKEALRKSEQLLKEGMALILFPEGRRSPSGRLGAAFPGPALIACRTGAPILPVAITGTEKIRGIAWLFRRPRITVNIGCPFYLPQMNGKLRREELGEFTHSIMEHIAALLPPEYRGDYGQGKAAEHESRKSG